MNNYLEQNTLTKLTHSDEVIANICEMILNTKNSSMRPVDKILAIELKTGRLDLNQAQKARKSIKAFVSATKATLASTYRVILNIQAQDKQWGIDYG